MAQNEATVCYDGSTSNSAVCNDLAAVTGFVGAQIPGTFNVGMQWAYAVPAGAEWVEYQIQRDGVGLSSSFSPSYLDAGMAVGQYSYSVRVHIKSGTGGATVNHFGPWSHVSVKVAAACSLQPVITASANTSLIWPPNHKMVPLTISGTISQEPGCSLVGAFYRLNDEYGVNQAGSLTVGPNGGDYSVTVYVEAWRLGTDMDGRAYTFTVDASNQAGPGTSNAVVATVPHDQR